MGRSVLKAGSPPWRTSREGLSDIAESVGHFIAPRTVPSKTHLQVQFPSSQYDVFSGGLLESLYTGIGITE